MSVEVLSDGIKYVPLSEVVKKIVKDMETGTLDLEKGFDMLASILQILANASPLKGVEGLNAVLQGTYLNNNESVRLDMDAKKMMNFILDLTNDLVKKLKEQGVVPNDFVPFVELHDLTDQIIKDIKQGKLPADKGVYDLAIIAFEENLPGIEGALKEDYLGGLERFGRTPHLIYLPNKNNSYEGIDSFRRNLANNIIKLVDELKKAGKLPQDFEVIPDVYKVAKKIENDMMTGKISRDVGLKMLKRLRDMLNPWGGGESVPYILNVLWYNNLLPSHGTWLDAVQEMYAKEYYNDWKRDYEYKRLEDLINQIEKEEQKLNA